MATLLPHQLPQPVSPAHAELVTYANSFQSPFLRLPGEIRNRIYTFAFTVKYVRKELSRPAVVEDWPHADRSVMYPMSWLISRTMVCRQFYAEASPLIPRLNEFRFSGSRNGEPFIKDLPQKYWQAIETIRLIDFSLQTVRDMEKFVDIAPSRFGGLEKIVVETEFRHSYTLRRERRFWERRLLQDDPEVSDAARKKILRQTAEAIQELRSKDWIHIDIKLDNILVNWTCDEDGTKTITDVALGDFDVAWKCPTNAAITGPHAVGNYMWRSPEAQTVRGMSKASDVFSFGLVCIYTLGQEDAILTHKDSEVVKRNMYPEQRVLLRHFEFFGPPNERLLNWIDDENWTKVLEKMNELAEADLEERPVMSFEVWGQLLGSEAQKMISGMTKIDPGARSTIDEVLAHPWWQEAV
ncbi:hypothetical protein AA0119_g11948 [Alternaria tenuissima]|uniref:Protein kinase domain-containing protein n=1 Tax=Alternaria tenuissima TaxID=119927 RepID=A0ABY0FW72_9PLEO|nr:hypothetical protein AA0120_g7682 [Alternaria tenuissima]RYN88321.1 hypothetical protein AA0119_g11948 [Alternaria tenuissima]RYO07040.1 hypothetical protein AA0121_g11846 [Alternaria tenuissima]